MGISLHMGFVGEPGGELISRGLSETDEGGLWKQIISLYGSSVRRTWREGSLTGYPEGYVKAGSGIGYVWKTMERTLLCQGL